jgi:hypothetical protein
MKPKKEGICDVCGSALIQRKDDNEASLKVRLANYYKSTAPLLDYYTRAVAFSIPSMGWQELKSSKKSSTLSSKLKMIIIKARARDRAHEGKPVSSSLTSMRWWDPWFSQVSPPNTSAMSARK